MLFNLKDRTFPLQMMSKMVINQSMPNIPLGQHRESAAAAAAALVGHETAPQTEADIRARNAKRYGLPLTSHTLTGPLPYYPIPTGNIIICQQEIVACTCR